MRTIRFFSLGGALESLFYFVLALALALPWFHQAPVLREVPGGAPFLSACFSVFLFLLLFFSRSSFGGCSFKINLSVPLLAIIGASLLLTVISLLSTITSDFDDPGRMVRMVSAQTGMLLTAVLVASLVPKNKFREVMGFFLAIVFCAITTVWLEWLFWGGGRVSGWLAGNPNYAAHKILPVALVFVVFCVEFFVKRRYYLFSLFLVFSMVSVGALALTGSGAANLAFFGAFVFYFIGRMFRFSLGAVNWKLLAIAMVGAVAVGGASLVFEPAQSLSDRLSAGVADMRGETVQGPKSDIATRLKRDVEVVSRYYDWGFFGIGPGQSVDAIAAGSSHNNYLQAWAEIGPMGFIFVIAIVICVIFIPAYSVDTVALRVAVLGLSVHMLALGGHIITVALAWFLGLRLLGVAWDIGKMSSSEKDRGY